MSYQFSSQNTILQFETCKLLLLLVEPFTLECSILSEIYVELFQPNSHLNKSGIHIQQE